VISDLRTVLWKEWKEIFAQSGSRRGTIVNWLFVIAIFGVLLPIGQGKSWFSGGIAISLWPTTFTATSLLADSIAGERERHTLDTLLASRLPNTAILFGKVLAALTFTWAVIALSVVAGWLAVNLTHRGDGIMWPTWIALAIIGAVMLATIFLAGIGVLVSMRSPTVRQANQLLTIGLFVIGGAVAGLLFAASRLPARITDPITDAISNLNQPTLIALLVIIVLALLVIPFIIAARRFTRPRLTLLNG
jgi:ABC-2 type transport system permease protein